MAAGGFAGRAAGLFGATRGPLFAFMAMGVLWGSFAAIVPGTKAMLGVDDAAWGLLLLCSASGGIVAMLAAPRIGARLGGWGVPVATGFLALAFALPGHMAAVWAFGAAMVFVGLGSGLLDVLMNARVSAIESERRLHLMNLNHGFYSLAYAAGAGATGLARSAGAGPAEVFTVAAALIGLMALATIEPGGRLGRLRPRPGAAAARLGLLPVLGGLVIFVAFLAENAAEVWSALHIERSLGGSPGQGSSGPALLGLTMAAGRLAGQAVVQRVPEARLLTGGLLLAAAGAALAALATVPVVAQAGFVVLGLGVSVVAPVAFALVGRLATEETRARAIARASVLGYLGFFVGPPALGALAEVFGLRASFLAIAGLLVLSLPLVALLLRGR